VAGGQYTVSVSADAADAGLSGSAKVAAQLLKP
jgi:hypothetical protein